MKSAQIFVIFSGLLMFVFGGCGDPVPDLGFEIPDSTRVAPEEWNLEGNRNLEGQYSIRLDSVHVRSGKYSLRLDVGTCTFVLPAGYKGDTVELRGYLMTESTPENNSRGFFLKTDDGGSELHSVYTVNGDISRDGDWHEYSLSIPLHKYAREIVFGAYYYGEGTMWVDDLSLLMDGKPLERARTTKILQYPALKDSSFLSGSGLQIDNISPEQIESLSRLCKIWGFIKYYHPYVARGDFNMDSELFRLLSRILAADDSREFDSLILGWIKSMGKVPDRPANTIEIEGLNKLVPDLDWMNDSMIGHELKAELRHILKNRNRDTHFYIAANPGIGNPVFKNESRYGNFAYPDEGYRLLALFRYWNIIQYFFPYKNLIKEDWNEILPEYIPKFLDAGDELEYRLAVLHLIARIHDTHANILGRDSVMENYYGNYHAPVQVRFIEDRAVVTGYYNNGLGKWSGLQPGDIMLSLDGKDVSEIVEERQAIYPASNHSTKLRDIARNLLRGDSGSLRVKYMRDGEHMETTISRYGGEQIDRSLDFTVAMPDSCYRLVNDHVGYIYLGNIKNDLLDEVFSHLHTTKGIIIDIRNYPSDFVVFTLGEYLMPGSRKFVRFTNPDITYPGLFSWINPPKIGETNPDYYKGMIVILVNELTQSQAEYTAMALRMAPNAFVMGSTTAGADGNVSRLSLPGNISTMISGIGVYYPDGTETQRVGIVPDIEVKPTINGIRQGRDELLEKAVELIENSDL
ncbi:S41 family peptidase [Bacteroidota bacterium]